MMTHIAKNTHTVIWQYLGALPQHSRLRIRSKTNSDQLKKKLLGHGNSNALLTKFIALKPPVPDNCGHWPSTFSHLGDYFYLYTFLHAVEFNQDQLYRFYDRSQDRGIFKLDAVVMNVTVSHPIRRRVQTCFYLSSHPSTEQPTL